MRGRRKCRHRKDRLECTSSEWTGSEDAGAGESGRKSGSLQGQKTQGQESLAGRAKQRKDRRKHRRRTFRKNRKCKEDATGESDYGRGKCMEELHMRRIFCDNRNGTDVPEFSIPPDSDLGIYLDTDMIHVRI